MALAGNKKDDELFLWDDIRWTNYGTEYTPAGNEMKECFIQCFDTFIANDALC